MPALAKPSLWASVAKEIPALVARQLEDNKPSTVTLLFSGKAWYKHEAFWIPAAIIGAIVICACIGLCALSGSEMRYAEPPGFVAACEAREAEEAEEAEAAVRAEEARKRRIAGHEWVAGRGHGGELMSVGKEKPKTVRDLLRIGPLFSSNTLVLQARARIHNLVYHELGEE
ncbi:uncharacterized protein B0J16DRAFT_373994 [Fusarium flagelliforme]|uniref:uncharacterized protein n=1 Tax=Fusarium flagelliforme TaxID=2675880 RepID=UPI001E8CB1A1|nr:uncharacterized protein B0J16DRAFT_373994 [Fusarium flagelliforme]KAH7183564.1 hypothetical protein B0J16DRAFT_373994 [Fusarium flagelliforme]